MWSYLLAAGGILGIWLAGRNNLWGWALGFVMQGGWIAYALYFDQHGFIFSAIAYAAVYFHNFRKWRAARDKPKITLNFDSKADLDEVQAIVAADKARRERDNARYYERGLGRNG